MRILILLTLLVANTAFGLQFVSQKIITAGSLGASVNSSGVDIGSSQMGSLQAVWAGGGSPVGTFTLEVSDDEVDAVASVTNWSTYPGSSIAINSDGDLTYSIADIGYRWARLAYARTSGTATINAVMIKKF
jgi:hypothetical protein